MWVIDTGSYECNDTTPAGTEYFKFRAPALQLLNSPVSFQALPPELYEPYFMFQQSWYAAEYNKMLGETFLLPGCNWQVLVERPIDRDHKKNSSCSVPWVPPRVQRKQLQVTKWLHIACEDKVDRKICVKGHVTW